MCDKTITGPERGMVVWKHENGKGYDFKVVHKTFDNEPTKGCDPGSELGFGASMPMSEFLGADGLAQLLGMIAVGPLKGSRDRPDRPIAVANLDQFVDLVHRFQTPNYEQSRRKFDDPDVRDHFGDANEYLPYMQRSLREIQRNF